MPSILQNPSEKIPSCFRKNTAFTPFFNTYTNGSLKEGRGRCSPFFIIDAPSILRLRPTGAEELPKP
jgi:hypothetical protein